MTGILIAAHQDLGPALRKAAEGIVGPMEEVETIALNYDESPADAQRRVEAALRRLDTGEGVLVLTDMLGGTATNLTLPFLDAGRVEVVAGVNLPMVLKAHAARSDKELGELAGFLREYGARNIVRAADVWNKRPQSTV